jgi:DNA-binding LytR/AlgR family response regulator
MRLGDAVAELGAMPGARTHRSWWVAKGAVQSVRRTNGRIALQLTNGIEAPVSRGYAPELREAGWLNG